MAILERTLQLLLSIWERLIPFVIIPAYQGAVILRLGRYQRTLVPGFHWKWPFVEESLSTNTVVTTLRLSPQTLTTKDNVGVVVAAIVKYQIRDLGLYVTQIWDQNDVLADVSMGAIRVAVHASTYAELMASPPEKHVVEEIRRQVNRYGFKIEAVTFTDLGCVKSLRLIMPQSTNFESFFLGSPDS